MINTTITIMPDLFFLFKSLLRFYLMAITPGQCRPDLTSDCMDVP
jgi:hypothetical protein